MQYGEQFCLWVTLICNKTLHKKSYMFQHSNSTAAFLTYLLTPWCRVLPEQLTGLQLVKKFPAFHRTQRFITALKSVHHLSPSWASPIQSTSHLLEIHPNINNPSTPRSPQWSLSLWFPHQDPVHPPLLTHTRHMPSPSILLDFITRTVLGEQYKSFSSSLCNLLHSTVTSFLLGPNILINTLFSYILSIIIKQTRCNNL